MSRRLDLQEILEMFAGLATDPRTGRAAVYFSPPESVKMVYPCIVYRLNKIDTDHADNLTYRATKQYSVTVIDKDPDSEIPDRFLRCMPMCELERVYPADNLNHWVFNLYY